ncbi:MAG: twin-arginine translocation pathway signal protein, partial [Alphaproteobacteria bacterium]
SSAPLPVAAQMASTVPAAPPTTAPESASPAIGGHDPVAYFSGAPALGSAAFTTVHAGATYRFASAANRAVFLAEPQRYLPQFGGYCAWAASQGRLAKPDPWIWRVVGGKLYLNCSPDAETKWLADVPGNIAKAEAFWASQPR